STTSCLSKCSGVTETMIIRPLCARMYTTVVQRFTKSRKHKSRMRKPTPLSRILPKQNRSPTRLQKVGVSRRDSLCSLSERQVVQRLTQRHDCAAVFSNNS